MKPQKNRFIAITAASLALVIPAFAADGSWNTTTTGALWTLDTNWVGNVIADGSGFTADFNQVNIVGATTVSLNGPRTIGNLIFGDTNTGSAGSWVLAGGSDVLTLAGATPTITVNALEPLGDYGASATISAGVVGTSGLTKEGVGRLILSGGTANTFSGPITVNAGMLGSLNSASLQNVAGAITVASGATFDAKAGFGANITNDFTLSGTGFGNNYGTVYGALNIRENANLTGAITLAADTLITHDWNIATVSGSITSTDTNLELKTQQAGQFGFFLNCPISLGTGSLTLSGIGTSGSADFNFSGTNSFTGGTLLKGGRVAFSNASAFGGGTVTFVSNTSLTGTANITHASPLTVNSGITATLGAAASVFWTQSGALTGDGMLTKNGLGFVTLSGGLDNTFTGPINVDAGTLGVLNGASIKNMTGAITVASGATFDAKQGFDSNNFTQNISIAGNGSGIVNHGALNIRENATVTGSVTLTADSKISHDWNNGTITGSVTGTNTNLQLTTLQSGQPPLFLMGSVNLGTGGITATGAGGISPISLSGTLNYTGETVVTAGTLKLSSLARLADSSTVRIASGAVLHLDFSGSDTVAALYLGATLMPVGTYGSLTSSATNKSADFEGAGVLTVSGASSYSTWAAANGIPGQPSSGDFDNDSLTNLVEYALGLSPTVSSVPAGTFDGSLLSYTKGTEAKANGDVTYEIEQSTTLGTWTVVVPNAPASATISYTLPSGQSKVFARLKVRQTP